MDCDYLPVGTGQREGVRELNTPIHIISLGAGVQSSALSLMAAHGDIGPMPTAAIFADTQAEPKSVYTWLEWLEAKLPFSTYRVTAGSLINHSIQLRYSKKTPGNIYIRGAIPAFMENPNGTKGLLGRKCTADFKIRPVISMCRKLIHGDMAAWRARHKRALKSLSEWRREVDRSKKEKSIAPMRPAADWDELQSDPLLVQWIGISSDEAHRIKESREPWIAHRYPLVDANISRIGCLNWMKDHGYPEPPRSACSFCPFHSDEEWLRLKRDEPDAFAQAVDYEKKLQLAASVQNVLRGKPWLHSSMVPIAEVDFSASRPGYEQVNLFGNECEGMCGV